MKVMQFGTHTQYSFWGNISYPSNKAAMLARNAIAKEFASVGLRVTKHSLTGQMRKYSGLGMPDGTIGTVYYLNVYAKENKS